MATTTSPEGVDLTLVANDPKFLELVRARNRLALIVTSLIVVVYFGYLLLAFAPSVMREHVSSSITLGFPLGLGVLLITFVLVVFYVWRSGRHLDPMLADLVRRNTP